MNTTGVDIHAHSALPRRSALLGALLLVGPALTITVVHFLAGGRTIPGDLVGVAEAVALLFWSPVPFSVPAVLRGDARDRIRCASAGHAVFGPYRTLMSDPHERMLTFAELAGLFIAVAVAVLV
jgi:hypothetical protein